MEITINIHDIRSSDWKPDIKIKVEDKTTAFDICDQIANEINILQEERSFYTLILLSTTASLRRIGSKIHCMRTLRYDDCILKAFETTSLRVPSKICRNGGSGYSNTDDVATESTYKWIYKDSRSVPLDFGDEADLSGDESSDDELELLPGDLQYIRQSDRKAFMLKRSKKDPNCWKKRYCVITDKFWCINTKYESPRAICLNLNSAVRIFDVRPAYNYQNAVILKDTNGSYYFRAFSPVDQQNWINELTSRISYQADHETIHLAEFIACDEELAMCNRQQKATVSVTHSNVFRYALSEVSNESIWMALSSGNLSEVLNHKETNSDKRTRKQSQLSNSPTSSIKTSVKTTSGDLPGPLNFASIDKVASVSPLATPREVSDSSGTAPPLNTKVNVESQRSIESIDSAESAEFHRPDRQSLLSSSSLLSSDPFSRFTNRSTSLALSLRIQRRGMQWLWDGMCERHPSLMRSMQFLQAVQYYRDMHRHDVEHTPRKIWMIAVLIYHHYLAHLKTNPKQHNTDDQNHTNGAVLEQLEEPDYTEQSPEEVEEEEEIDWLPSVPSSWRDTGNADGTNSNPGSRPQSRPKSKPKSSTKRTSKKKDQIWHDVGSDENTIWNIRPASVSKVHDSIETHRPKASRFMSRIRPNSIAQFMGSAAATLSKLSESPDKLRNSRPEKLVSEVTISDNSGVSQNSTQDGSSTTVPTSNVEPGSRISTVSSATDTRASSQSFFSSWFGSNTSNLFNTQGTASTASTSEHREQSLLSAARSSITNPTVAATGTTVGNGSVAKRRGSYDTESISSKRREFELELHAQYINYDFDSVPPSISLFDDILLEIEKRVINCTTTIPFSLNCQLRDSLSFRSLGLDGDNSSVYSGSTQNDPLRPKARRFGFVFRKKYVPNNSYAPQQNAARQSYARLKNIFEVANGQGARLVNTVVNISKESSKSARTLMAYVGSSATSSGKSTSTDSASRYARVRPKVPSLTPLMNERLVLTDPAGINNCIDTGISTPQEEADEEESFEEDGIESDTLQTYLELVEDIANSAKSPRSLSTMQKSYSKSELSSSNTADATPDGSPTAASARADRSNQDSGNFTPRAATTVDSVKVSQGVATQVENIPGNRVSLIRSRWESDTESRQSEIRSLDGSADHHFIDDLEQLNDRFGDMSFHFEPYTGSRTPSAQSPTKLVGIASDDQVRFDGDDSLNDDDDDDDEGQHEVTG